MRQKEGGGARGPLPGAGGRPEEEDNRRAQRQQLQTMRREEGGSARGPLPGAGGRPEEEDNRRARRQQLQTMRQEEGGSARGPLPGAGGRPEEEDNRKAQRQQLQTMRQEEGGGPRGPLPGTGGRPYIPEDHKHGPPYRNEELLSDEETQRKYKDFVRSWARFGLSRICKTCGSMTPARHCRPTGPAQTPSCRNCRENKTRFRLPALLPVPPPLQQLKPIEQHLLAMARISQVVLDKLPSGGPSAQWGRMYAVLMEDPCICDVLTGAVLQEDGTVQVQGVDGLTESPARLENLHNALNELRTLHKLYRNSPAVHEAIEKMSHIMKHKKTPSAKTEANQDRNEAKQAEADEEEGQQFTYLVPKDFKVPRADTTELRQTRSSAALIDDIDVKFFPHLFPEGTDGWKQEYQSFAQYARKRLLSQDQRFETSASYIMWLLETQMKKRLSGNVNVRVGMQQKPGGCHGYQDGSRRVYTALRDIPGTQPYLYAKKGIALNMYEQLGQPQFFLTLTCHAQQPSILLAAISARLLRLNPNLTPAELLGKIAYKILYGWFTVHYKER